MLTFVLDGLFAVHLSRNESAPVALLGPGELVGEISFLENLPATASVVAIEDSRVLCIARSDLLQRISADLAFATDFYRALARMLSRRLRERSLALAAGVGDRSTGGFMLTPAWLSLVAVLARFKELLWRADVAAEHSDRPIAPELVSDIQRMFEDLCQSLTELKLHITTDAALTEVEGALRREFTPYLHLTRVTRRVFTWPRGYAGDFLTIDWMYGNEPGGVAPLGPLLDKIFLELPVSRCVRNRRRLLAGEIALALRRGGGSASVASLASGPATEVFDVYSEDSGAKLKATLIDIDFQALAFVADRRDAAGLTKNIRLEHANLVYLATGRCALDLTNQNLVYSIGLIDYFEDRFVIALLNWIHGCLLPGGKAILGNIHTRNPYRGLMDLVLGWKLIHRTEDDMNRLFAASSFGRPCSEILFEPEGINMFACGLRA